MGTWKRIVLALGMLAPLTPTPADAQGSTNGRGDLPASIPNDFIPTPSGYFHPSCVISTAQGDVIDENNNLTKKDGTVRAIPPCRYPRYNSSGAIIHGNAQAVPDAAHSTWAAWSHTTVPKADTGKQISLLSSRWTVPANPPNGNTGQLFFLFNAIEPTPNSDGSVSRIIQPVLGWNQDPGYPAWSVMAWNCCINGVATKSSPIGVSPGDQLYAEVRNSSMPIGNNWTVKISKLVNNIFWNPIITWNTSAPYPMIEAFGGVLEVYDYRMHNDCRNLPPGGGTTFSDVQLYNSDGVRVYPIWFGSHRFSPTPNCNYSADGSPSQTIVFYTDF